jgi:hypothetical protein
MTWVFRQRADALPLRANPAKVEDFGDEDLLQDIGLTRILFGEAIPLRPDALYVTKPAAREGASRHHLVK